MKSTSITWFLAVASTLSVVLVFSAVPSYADHITGHDTVARDGIKGLDERVWNLETALPGINLLITGLQSQIDALPSGGGVPSVKNVDCPVDSLQDAVEAAVPGDIINVTGTCNEQIVITTNKLTIDGGGTAVIDGDTPVVIPVTTSLVQVRSDNVTIRGLIIQDSIRHGITFKGHNGVLESSIIEYNANLGIAINDNGHARIGASRTNHTPAGESGSEGNIIRYNGTNGININFAGSAKIFHNKVNNNGGSGIRITVVGSADLDGNVIIDNTRDGIFLRSNSAVRLANNTAHGRLFPGVASENNLIQGNDKGVECQNGSALEGKAPNFGTGNTNGNTDIGSSCVERVSSFP